MVRRLFRLIVRNKNTIKTVPSSKQESTKENDPVEQQYKFSSESNRNQFAKQSKETTKNIPGDRKDQKPTSCEEPQPIIVSPEHQQDITTPRNQAISLGVPQNLPDELMRLAIINSAFREGIIQISRLNLDEDLYWKAIFDLRDKYYDARKKAHLSDVE